MDHRRLTLTFAAFLLTADPLGDRFRPAPHAADRLETFVGASIAVCAGAVTDPAAGGAGDTGSRRRIDVAAEGWPSPRQPFRTRGRAPAPPPGWGDGRSQQHRAGPATGRIARRIDRLALDLLGQRAGRPAGVGGEPPRTCRIRAIRTLGASTCRVSVWPSWRSVPPRWCWSRDTIGARQQTVAIRTTALAAFVAFLGVQRRSRHPMLPLDLFGNRQLAGALLATFAMTFGIYGLLR